MQSKKSQNWSFLLLLLLDVLCLLVNAFRRSPIRDVIAFSLKCFVMLYKQQFVILSNKSLLIKWLNLKGGKILLFIFSFKNKKK